MAQLRIKHQEELTELHKKRGEVKIASILIDTMLSGLVGGGQGGGVGASGNLQQSSLNLASQTFYGSESGGN